MTECVICKRKLKDHEYELCTPCAEKYGTGEDEPVIGKFRKRAMER
ncbi:hypothetical protein F373_gp115 [Bacillus phage SP-10]|nr:hypothetical protein F373_gp115 [Bacillus phage SP-10]WCS67986.1 hypothetical protein Goe26_00740 [Bacillus phage vB_BsuM-Goe26]BAK52927.1 hypothetical protein [Bacillus phage SP-10]GLI90572.1 hypothetical protein ANABIO4_39240 [Bacillus subtilis]